jgi:CspA family cold shock protein
MFGATGPMAHPTRCSANFDKDYAKMATGTVKWFNATKGFGFIKPDDGGNDVFVHISAVEAAGLNGLNDDQTISYELVEDRRGRSSAGELKLL